MKKLLAALTFGAFALTHGPILAQVKTSEQTKKEVKKTDTTKDEAKKTDTKKEGKKKVKKGGC